ncbi:zeta toxin family protein [Kitasatospora sp. NPDC001574]
MALDQVVLSAGNRCVASQERPVVVFVAGQAGSGKTLVVDLVHAALARRGGVVRVDRNAYKAVHPRYRRFLAEDVRTAGVRVRTDTYGWQAQLEDRLQQDHPDAVVEAALTCIGEFGGAKLTGRRTETHQPRLGCGGHRQQRSGRGAARLAPAAA